MSPARESDILIMAKPVGPQCNLACQYCYYLCKSQLFAPGASTTMSAQVLEEYIRQRLETSTACSTHFEWHGGEPTLRGVEFFRRVVELQRKYATSGRTVTNGIQTNGALIDQQWVDFLREASFSVGLSLDGPAKLHDCYRVNRGGGPTHADAVRALHLLQRAGVHTDVLCVVHAANAPHPESVYRFFRNEGVRYLQFLPLVERASGGAGKVTERTAAPEQIGAFLCNIFDAWLQQDLGKAVVQTFDEAFRTACGLPHALCIFRETCGDVWVLEHDGSLFPCDHFVDEAHRLGSILEPGLRELLDHPLPIAFGRAKRDALPGACLECDVLSYCNGGCPKDRIVDATGGEPGLCYLCNGYRMFFRHCRPGLERLAVHWKSGRPLREFSIEPNGGAHERRTKWRSRSSRRT